MLIAHGEGLMAYNVHFSSASPMDDLDQLCESLKNKESKILLLLPDELSIRGATEYISEHHFTFIYDQILPLTMESLSNKILQNENLYFLPSETSLTFFYQALEKISSSSSIASRIIEIVKDSDMPWNEDIIKDLYSEFDEYLRAVPHVVEASEAEKSISHLKNVAETLDLYRKERALEAISLFEELKSEWEEMFESLPPTKNMVLSRTHLIGKAITELREDPELIEKNVGSFDSIWVFGIPFIDHVALLFLIEIAKVIDVLYLNVEEMIADRLKVRIEAISRYKVEFSKKSPRKEKKGKTPIFIKCPDRRREIEAVLFDILKRVKADKSLNTSDFVIIARDSGNYLPYVEELFRDYGIPYHVQTRRILARTTPFQFVKAILNLLAKAESDDPITADEISSLFRLGLFFKTGGPHYHYVFLREEATIGRIGSSLEWRYGSPGNWSKWNEELSKHYMEELRNLADWVTKTIKLKPTWSAISKELSKFMRGVVDVESPVKYDTGYEHDHFRMTELHITARASMVFGAGGRVDDFSGQLRKLRPSLKPWKAFYSAFLSVASGESYGIALRDADAVQVVDVGISHFVWGKRRYALGICASEIPRETPTGVVFSHEFRDTVNKSMKGPIFIGPEEDFEIEKETLRIASQGFLT